MSSHTGVVLSLNSGFETKLRRKSYNPIAKLGGGSPSISSEEIDSIKRPPSQSFIIYGSQHREQSPNDFTSLLSPRQNDPHKYKKKKGLFQIGLNKLGLKDRTFNELPCVVHEILLFLYHSLLFENKYFEDKPISYFKLRFEASRIVVKENSQLMISQIDKMSIEDLLKKGFTMNDSYLLKQKAQSEDRCHFFYNMNLNNGITNEEYVTLNHLVRRYNNETKPNLYKEVDVKMGFLLLKNYLLNLPVPLLSSNVLNKLDMILMMKDKINKDKMALLFIEEIKTSILEHLNGENECRLEIIKEIILFIKFVCQKHNIIKEEKESMYLCYFNAMLQNNFFRKEYIDIIEQICSNEIYSKEINDVYQFDGEFIIKKYCNVLFAPYIIPNDVGFDNTNVINGNLFITTQRIVFISKEEIDVSKFFIVKQLGTTFLFNINSIQIIKKESCHYLRLYRKDLKIITFKLNGETDNYEMIINDLKTNYQCINETDFIPLNLYQICSTNKIISFDCQRLGIKESVEFDVNYIPKFPTFNCEIKSISGLKPIIIYQNEFNSKLLRFPIGINDTNESINTTTFTLYESGITILPIKCELKPKNVIEKCFKKIQDIVPNVNFDLNKNISIYNDATIEFSGFIKDTLIVVKNVVKEMQRSNSILLLQPYNLIEIVIDPYYRTIDGFLFLFQKELLSVNFFEKNSYDNSIYFILLLCSLDIIIHENSLSFEFDDHLIRFLFCSYLSNRFSEFNEKIIDSRNSIIRYILVYKSYFFNISYKPNELSMYLVIPECPCCILFDEWMNFNKEAVCLYTTKTMTTKNTNMNLVDFPPIPLSLNILSTISIINLNNNRLKEFPLALCQLSHLKEIRLNDNSLFWITPLISELSNLTFLGLANNKLTQLPDLSNIPLRKLDISSNCFPKEFNFEVGNDLELLKAAELNNYPAVLRDLPCLTSLDCSKCHFDISDIISRPPINLQELIISGCHLPIIPEEITQLSITKLDVSDNSINKMNYSFFTMTNLRVLNLSQNHTNGKNALFKTMKSLTVICNNVKTKKYRKSILSPNTIWTGKDINGVYEETQIQQLEKIIITGDEFRKEVFSYLQRKMGKEGTVQTINDCSFIFESKEQKKKKNKIDRISVVCMSVNQMKERIWKLHRSVFVICKNEKNGNEIDEIFEILSSLKKPITGHVVFGTEMNAKVLSKYNKEIFTLDLHFYTIEKKSKKCPTLVNKIMKQIIKFNEINETIEEESGKLVKELEGLTIPGFCLTIGKIKEVMCCLELSQIDMVLEFLIKNGYFLTNEDLIHYNIEELLKDEKEVVVDCELFNLTDKLLKKGSSRNGFITTSVFEVLGIKDQHLEFIISILEMYGIILQCTAQTFANIGISNEFNKAYNSCVDQTKYISSELMNKENSSNGSSFVPFLVTELRDIEGLLIYPYHELVHSYENSSWPLQHHKNENEIGRSFILSKYNDKIINTILCSFMIKYEVHCYWRNGAIVVIEDTDGSGKGYLMVSVDESKRSVNIRIRFLVSNERIPFYIAKVIKSNRILLENILDCYECKIEKQQIMCPECLMNGNINCLTEREINESIEKFKFHVKSRVCIHTINTVSCSLDMIIETLPKKYLKSLNEYDLIKDVGVGSNSIISLFKQRKTQELIVAKIGKIDLSDNGLDDSNTSINIFANLVEEYLREIFFITFPKSDYIAQIYGYCINPLFVTMEYFNGGSLYHLINETSMEFTNTLVLDIAKQIAFGMNEIHSYKMPLIHRDLKSPNILIRLNEDGSFKNCALSDFGQTVPVSANINAVVECPYWLAPEVINGEPFTQKSDVFSYAIILWELKNKQPPYKSFKYFSDIREKVKNGWRLPLGNSFKFLNEIISQCWDPIPQNRPSFKQIVDKLNGIVI
ncbi:protein kinase putative [Entamoeba histolytica]|uniref:Protein kinase putative n=1 Tax=Entamoeba histolytica TaxID=5759 RepID=A0A175JRJ7_ENTHI|nr:protein kinase putative [Entamoeba histolytica]